MELYNYLKVLLTLSFVIALIIIFAALIKKLNFLPNLLTKKNSKLSIEDMLVLDRRRKIILIKYADSGHLILLSHNHETVIKSDINLKEVLN
ncbi:MAG: hypothetical protein AB8U25_02900 [Rickettsiales endosymbiont of Dermacentor nuttalli]